MMTEGGNPDLIAAAKRFLEDCYRTFDANRSDLGSLYQEESVMIFDGWKLQAKEAMLAELISLQWCWHQIYAVHYQPTVVGGSDLLATVTCYMWLDGEHDIYPFSQVWRIHPFIHC